MPSQRNFGLLSFISYCLLKIGTYGWTNPARLYKKPTGTH